jgi:hypothetical protein
MQQRIDMASEQGITRSGESLHGIVWDVMDRSTNRSSCRKPHSPMNLSADSESE